MSFQVPLAEPKLRIDDWRDTNTIAILDDDGNPVVKITRCDNQGPDMNLLHKLLMDRVRYCRVLLKERDKAVSFAGHDRQATIELSESSLLITGHQVVPLETIINLETPAGRCASGTHPFHWRRRYDQRRPGVVPHVEDIRSDQNDGGVQFAEPAVLPKES